MTSPRANTRESTSTMRALDSVNLSAYDRAVAEAQILRTEAIIDGLERIVRAVHHGLLRFSELNTVWRLNSTTPLGSMPRLKSTPRLSKAVRSNTHTVARVRAVKVRTAAA